MKLSDQEIGNLLSLKRHERPPEGYMDDFLREFHQRRREEAMEERGLARQWKQFVQWLTEPGMAKWAYGGGVAYAAVLAIVMTAPKASETESLVPAAIDHRVVAPAPVIPQSQLDELDLRPGSEGSLGEQEF
ncbi:hypothetical protein [Haloferula rosea]|uniref:Uncharacterized protein n=1 Tax=Haloferula rosea TaxID=490093 RepID=A0A934RCL9_9BACT|nr:hypothetical protein [Haloferula rosea]MBK1825990.1 hypothetical protein [Haloferula rosea]